MELRQLYFIIADISGYTRFVTSHRESLLHAEQIIGNLLEAVMREVKPPCQIHELLGDAVTLYAPAEQEGSTAQSLYEQICRMREAFYATEATHISGCSLCACNACTNVDKLRLKVIAHTGEAAMTSVAGIRKISGENVILSHRWLKNSIPSKDYILLTDNFANAFPLYRTLGFVRHQENLEGLGLKTAFYLKGEHDVIQPAPQSYMQKLLRHTQLNLHAMRRTLGRKPAHFRNLES